MPLYCYECQECEHVFEIFQHNSDVVEVECEQCEQLKCERLISFIYNRTKYSARENLHRRINPEVDRIMDKVSKGSDKDFLDITGS